MFGRRYVVTCSDCDTEYVFKSGKRARKFYDGCLKACPRCGEEMSLWIPLSRLRVTPPPDLKEYKANIAIVSMD